MKQKLLKLTCLLCACMMGMSAWGADTYTQLTSIASIDESADYVLGVEGTGFHYSGTSSWGLTALPSAQTPIYYKLTKAADGQSFTAQATISGTTYYLQIPTTNTFSMATSAGTNTDIIIGTDNQVANKTTTDRHLRINGTSGLRSYANSTGTMAFFYKVTHSAAPSISFATASVKIPVGETYTQTATTANTTGSVVYSSDDTDVATVDPSTGEVTAVAAGTATITATVAADGIDASYDVEVFEVEDGVFDFSLGYDYGSGLTFSNVNNEKHNVTFTAGNITLTTAGDGNSCLWANDNTFRIYSGESFTIAAPTGYEITEIAFSGSNVSAVTVSTGSISSGTWTGKSQSVTITRGSSNPAYTKIEVTYSVQSGNKVAEASISATAITVGQNTATITTDPAGLVVSYESDATSVATVSAAGVVTPIAAGTATITASWLEQTVGGETYDAGSKTFDVTVYAIEDGVFDFEHIDYGQIYVTEGYATADFSATAGNIEILVSNRYRFWNADRTLRLYKEGAGNSSEETLTNAEIILAAPAGYVITAVDFGVTATSLTPDEGTISGKTWTGLANTIAFTHGGGNNSVNIKKITVTYTSATYTRSTAAGNYGTLCLPYDATVEGATIYTIAGKEENGGKVTALVLAEAASVEAGKPYIFKATANDVVATYTGTTYTDAGNVNGLYGTYTAINGFSAGDLYLMTTSNVQAADDATASLGANRAYILMNEVSVYDPSSSVKGIRLGFDGTETPTAIKGINAETMNGAIYNLNGQQLNSLQRGINIVNGKKVLVK